MKALAIVFMLMLVAVTGCSRGTPPAVTALHVEMEATIAAMSKANAETVEFLIAAYEVAVREHVETIMDYEILMAGDTIATDRVRELLTNYRAKHAEIRDNITGIREELARGQVAQVRLQQITAKLGQWLAAQKDETEELRKRVTVTEKGCVR